MSRRTPVCARVVEDWSACKRVYVVQSSKLSQRYCWELVLEEGIALAYICGGPWHEDCATIHVVADDGWSIVYD